MTTLAPASLLWLSSAWRNVIPNSVFSGIVGDKNHTYGYHISREDLLEPDYSTELADDLLGPNNLASAIDMSMNTTDMKLVTSRLIASAKDANDERLNRVREFIGTVNGSTVVGVDTQLYPSDVVPGYGDNGHLSHVHISFSRRYANDKGAAAAVLSIVAGMTVQQWRSLGGWSWDGDVTEMSTQADTQINFVYHWALDGGSSCGVVVDPDGTGKRSGNSAITKMDFLTDRAQKTLDVVTQLQSTGGGSGVAPTQEQINIAVKEALSDPTVVAGIAAAFASHITVH